jgi:TatD DNase family protein
MYIDTHTHIYFDKYDKDRKQIINNMEKDELDFIVSVGIDMKSSEQSIQLSNDNKRIFATIGFHPSEADLVNANSMDKFKKMSRNDNVVAIGEIGLDYYRNYKPKDIQKKALRQQLELAEELNLPVVIHNRDSHHDIHEELKNFNGRVRGIMHSFSGNYDFAKKILNLGYYISITGVITFRNAPELRDIVKKIPLDRLLTETDCPFLTPEPYRGKRNQPAYVRYITQKISEVKGISVTDTAKQLLENTNDIFNINL